MRLSEYLGAIATTLVLSATRLRPLITVPIGICLGSRCGTKMAKFFSEKLADVIGKAVQKSINPSRYTDGALIGKEVATKLAGMWDNFDQYGAVRSTMRSSAPTNAALLPHNVDRALRETGACFPRFVRNIIVQMTNHLTEQILSSRLRPTEGKASILDGQSKARAIREQLKSEISTLPPGSRKPGLAVVLVGSSNPASQTYVHLKEKACSEVGIKSVVRRLPATITTDELLKVIGDLNTRADIDGILVQLPLPFHLDEEAIVAAVAPEKDVDGFNSLNLGNVLRGRTDGFTSCAPLGIHRLLLDSGIPIEGRHVVIVGKGRTVGKPLAALFLQNRRECNATVTVVFEKTENIKEICRLADIIITAVGKPNLITRDMVKPGAVVVDAGFSRVGDRVVGDVDFAGVAPVCSGITPVPGGVGPMTIAALLENTVKSYRRHMSK